MLKIYTVPGCPAVRRIKQHLKEHGTEYTEINLYRALLDDAETTVLQSVLGSGMSREELRNNPSVIRKPLIVSDTDDEDTACRLMALRQTHCTDTCPRWSICGKVWKQTG